MKSSHLFAVTLLAGLAGCRQLGYNDQSANNALTPGVSEKDYTRTYSNGSSGTPSVQDTTPATTADPASPNYAAPRP